MRSSLLSVTAGAVAVLAISQAPAHAADAISVEDEAALLREARADVILRLVFARSPDLAEVRERVRAAEQRAQAVGGLPDLEFKYEQWAVPLARPYALDQAGTLMFGLRQTFPAWGSLDAKREAAVEDARLGAESQRGRGLDLRRSVRRTLAEYYRADREYRIHLEHVAIATRVVDLTRAHYRAGQGTQQDVLRAIVELSRLHTEVAEIEQQRGSARLLLNALMSRAPDAPLGPAPEPVAVAPPAIAEIERRLDERRPEIASAAHAIRKSEATLAGARREAYLPSFMIGADYWYMPTNAPTQHAYGAMLAFNLPWLWGRHRAEVRAAEHTLAADRFALVGARTVAEYELRDASLKVKAALDAFTILDRDLLAEARQSYQAAEAAYAAGQSDSLGLLDALRSDLQVRLDRSRALARLESSLADLERAGGDERTAP